MIRLTSSGDWNKTTTFLKRMISGEAFSELAKYGKMGVAALEAATPEDSRLTSNSWAYRIVNSRLGPRIEWYNTNAHDGVNVAVLIQYGHATRGGTYVAGIDYINPAMRPIFDSITDEIWKKVKT